MEYKPYTVEWTRKRYLSEALQKYFEDDVSVEYIIGDIVDILDQNENYYREKANKYHLNGIEMNQKCVAYDPTKDFYSRVLVKNQLSNSQISCFLVDSGEKNLINRKNLFEIDKEFLKTKFQVNIQSLE